MTQGRRGRWWWVVLALAAGLLWWLWRSVSGAAREAGAPEDVRVGVAVGGRAGTEAAVDLRLALRASVSGKVRDPQGAAVAGAKVCAIAYGQGLTRQQAVPHCVVSGRDGYYRIDELWPVPHGVHASAPGFIATAYSDGDRRSIALRPGMDRRDVDVTLSGGGVEIFGVVRDLSGGAVEGARVFVTGGAVRGDGVALTESGVDGEFSLWVRPGEAQVWASGDGYAQGVDIGAAPGHRFEVFLTPEAVLVGTLLRADDGTPVEGAEVGASRGDVGMSWSVNIGGGSVISDAHGRFRIEGLQAGAYKVVAGSDAWTGSAAEQVVLGVGETSAPIVVAMHAAFVVEAEVVADGGPGCGGSVMLEDRVRGRNAFGQVDVEGKVRVQRVLPGDYSVQLRCDGYVVDKAPEPVRVVDAGVEGLRWKVAWGRSLAGVVVDAKGRPAAGVWVYAKQENLAQATVGASGGGNTDALGRFVVNGLQAGTYRLSLQDWNGGRAMPAEPTVVQVGERGAEGVRIELPASGEVRGTVRDEQGRPLPRVWVQLSAAGLMPGANVGDDGTFGFTALAPGSYRVAAWRGSEPLRAPDGAPRTVDVSVGTTTKLDLVFAAANGEIRGVVRDEDGGALADAFVSARLEVEGAPAGAAVRERWMSSGDRPRLSEADGQFTLTGLMPGKYSLLAQRRGGGEATREHVAVGETVTLTIAAVGRISGRVVLPGGGAPEEFDVSVWDRSSGFRRRDSNFRSDGAWGFAELPAGNYEVEVTAAEGVVKRSVALAAGEVRGDVLVELAGMTRVSGTVVDTEGAPVAGVEVLIRGDHSFEFGRGDGDRRHVSDANGRFEVERVPVGTVMLMAMATEAGYSAPRMNVRIPAGERFELPPLRIARERVAQGELSGDLGFVVQGPEPGAELDGRRYVVSSVQAGGAAAQAGLVVGDEIVTVDGTAVAGGPGYLFDVLTRVSAGTTVQLGLARGGVVALVAAGG